MNCITQLEKSCQTILEDIRNQEKTSQIQKKMPKTKFPASTRYFP